MFVLVIGCAGADQETEELRAFLQGRDDGVHELSELNLALGRDAVRVASYARAGVTPPPGDAWSPIVEVNEDGSERPFDVARWLDAGDIDARGRFEPCAASACDAVHVAPAALERIGESAGGACLDQRAQRVAGAALRIHEALSEVEWGEPSDRALVIDVERGSVRINPRLVALIGCSEPPLETTPSVAEPEPPQPATRPASDTLKSHDPPEGTEEHGDSGCDCDDNTSCTNDSSSNNNDGCALQRSRPRMTPTLIALAALALVLRRRRRGTPRRTARRPPWPFVLLALLGSPSLARAQAEATAAAASAELVVNGFAPDASIAIDGKAVAVGTWRGSVAPGRHLVQVYKPGGPAYDFWVDAIAGQTATVPPPAPQYAPPPYAALPVPPAEPPRPPKPKKRWRVGPYLLAQIGFVVPTAKPDGFNYELRRDEDTGQDREQSGIGYMVAAVGGYRVASWFGVGGILAYASAGGDGTVTQTERSSTGALLDHEGPADLTIQSVRLGPQARFMAGGDRARFVGAFALGLQHTWVDLEHVHVEEEGGVLVERGTFHHDYSGWGQFTAFDLGAEFNVSDHLLLGVALDIFIDGTSRIDGDPFGDTALGYVGMSARVGWHDWRAE